VVTTRKAYSSLALLALVVAGAAACSDSPPPGGPGGVGDPCVDHEDCEEGLYCSATGRCYDPNAADGDGDGDTDADVPTACEDRDGDGHDAISVDCPGGDDCNDYDPSAHPGLLEACDDGVDNDCNGVADEPTCRCARGSARECYTGPDGTLGHGICRAGRQPCLADQTYGECLGEQLPADGDECGNMTDDDCDGAIDEDCDCDPGCRCDELGAGPECECNPPTDQPCYSGSPSTGSVEPCQGGRRDCVDAGGGIYRWSDCEGEVLPAADVCDDGIDQDCDGLPDDGCGPAADGDGDGFTVFAGDCDDADPERHPGATETCDGYDQNCDGEVDETCDCVPGDSQACFTGPPASDGRGVCTPGTQTCEGTAEFRHFGPCTGGTVPSIELCDGLDNDCDGEVDEDALDGNGCGECVFAETACDGVDDDCDGLVDEDLVNSCGLCPPLPCYTEPYEEPGDCEASSRNCDGTGPWEDDPTAVTLTQGTVRTPVLYIAVNSRDEVAQMDTITGAKNWQVPSHGLNPSRTAVAYDYSVWVANRGYDGNTNNPADSNVVHLDIDGSFICRADVIGLARGLAIDADGFVWAGTWSTQRLMRVDPDTCMILDDFYVGVNVYGLTIDGSGYVWTASDSGSVGAYTARVDTRAADPASTITYYPNHHRYGITADIDGNIWMGDHSGGGGVHRFAPPVYDVTFSPVRQVTGIAYAPEALPGPDVVAPGPAGIWGSQYNIHRVTHIDPVTLNEVCGAGISCADGSGYSGDCRNPHGVAAVADGTIWVPIRFGGFVDVYDRNCNLLHVYPVDPGQELYTYSDMAGTQLMTVTTRTGHWIQDFDSGYDDPFWSSVTWTADPLPPETSVEVTVVAAETQAGLRDAPSEACGPFVSGLGANEAPIHTCAAIQGLRWLRVDVALGTTRNEIRPVVRTLDVHWAY
jgi:hypothetical protein